jgi:hypothetical protein
LMHEIIGYPDGRGRCAQPEMRRKRYSDRAARSSGGNHSKQTPGNVRSGTNQTFWECLVS